MPPLDNATPATGAAVTFRRTATLTREEVNAEDRTVEFALASETPVRQWWGTEVLSHDRTAVRLGRLASGRHPLLMDHNHRDQVGVITRAWISDDRKLRCIARFGNSARAQEIFQDVKDGIRSLVSVGYQVHAMRLVRSSDETGDEFLVEDWEPVEGSIVAVPADADVGIGRDAQATYIRSLTGTTPPQATPKATLMTTTIEAPEVDLAKEREAGTQQERHRVREINALASKFGQQAAAAKAIEEGTSYDAFREAVFTGLAESKAIAPAADERIGLTERESKAFSFCRLLAATLYPNDAAVRKIAGFELACAQAAADKRLDTRADRHGALSIPMDVLNVPLDLRAAEATAAMQMAVGRAMAGSRLGQRDLNVGTASAGGNLVATNLLAASFIEILVAKMRVMAMGATVLSDLSGNIAIPRATGGATSYWVAESGSPTESQAAFDQVGMTPKTVGAYSDYSRKLLLQSSIAVEAFVRMDLARAIALAIDLGAIAGTGAANQPRGILNTAGIGSVAGGANGAAPTWANIVALETAVANANVDETTMGYLTNTRVRGELKKTQRFSGTDGRAIWQDGNVNDYRAEVSNQVPSNLTKGTSNGICSAILFGNWQDLIIGMWGGLDVMIDPYTGGTSGTKRCIVLQDVDVAVRYPVAFAAMQDALTT